MVIIMTMIMINIHEAKARLSEFLEAAAQGERVLICNRNRPVAELRALPDRTGVRDFTPAYPGFAVAADFFAPLPDDDLDAFEAGGGDWPAVERVAEATDVYARSRPVPKRGSPARHEAPGHARREAGRAAGRASGRAKRRRSVNGK